MSPVSPPNNELAVSGIHAALSTAAIEHATSVHTVGWPNGASSFALSEEGVIHVLGNVGLRKLHDVFPRPIAPVPIPASPQLKASSEPRYPSKPEARQRISFEHVFQRMPSAITP